MGYSMKFENTRVSGFENAFIGMREPFQSFDKSDSFFGIINNDEDYWRQLNKVVSSYNKEDNHEATRTNWLDSNCILQESSSGENKEVAMIGHNDLDLAHRLLSTGSDSDGKFLRYLHCQVQITAPQYFFSEADTYKIGTVRNSSSIQHIGAKRDYTIDDFALDLTTTYPNDKNNIPISSEADMQTIVDIVNKYRQLYKQTNDYKYFRIMRQMMPQSYMYTIMWDANYQTLRNIYRQRILRPHRLKEWTEDFSLWLDTLPYADDLIKYGLD